jgi:hypothetical protein
VIEIKINNIPRYMGFLVYLKIPEFTRVDACSILTGLTVVFFLINLKIAEPPINKPSTKNKTLNNFKNISSQLGNRQ